MTLEESAKGLITVACGMVYPRLFDLIPVLFLVSMMDHVKNLQPLEWGFVYLERSDI